MKKLISMLLALIMVFACVPTFAMASETDGTITLGEIQEMLVGYLNDIDQPIEPGTKEFYEYVVDQLLDHSDKALRSHEKYDLIHAYMVEYKVAYEDYLLCQEIISDGYDDQMTALFISEANECVEYNSSAGTVEFALSDEFLDKSINDIICENQARDAVDGVMPTAVSGYTASDAANYATTYANSNNSTYPYYSAGDCTNFVSQCLYAGGLNMLGSSATIGTHETTTSWYCVYIKSTLTVRQYAVSTSWVRVTDFNTYMNSKVVARKTKTTLSTLISACAVGDVVLLADKTTGTPYHAIIITDKDASTAYFSGHTTARNNADMKDHLDASEDKFYLFDLT